VSDAPFYVMLF